MNKLFKSVVFSAVIILLFQSMTLYADCYAIRKNTLRLHIIASSDGRKDQQLKLELRDHILDYTSAYFTSAISKQDAENRVSMHISEITCLSQKFLAHKGYNKNVTVQLKNMYFGTRVYDSFTLPAGYYDALRITIGEGKGHNWWCVMFPQLCVPAASKRNEDIYTSTQQELVNGGVKYEYKFKIAEFFENVFDFFKH